MTNGPIDVVHLQRKPGPGLHSIERLFADVREQLAGSDIQVRVRINDYMSRGIRPRLHDAWMARRHQGQVNHVTGDVHYLCWWLDPSRTVLTVHDCVGLSRMRGLRRSVFKQLWYTRPLQRSKFVTVVSEFTRRELIAETGVNAERVHVIHPHLSAEFVPEAQTAPGKRLRVLQIGTAPNKNIERLAAALAGLPVDLMVVGKLDASQRYAIQQAGISFSERTSIPREAMPRMYAEADIIAFASTYEGFGLPIIEGQAIGRPVVTSNCCSMPEAAGDAACIVDPFDVANIRAGFQKIIENPGYRDSLVQSGFRNVERFRLPCIAAQYADLYRRVAEEAQTSQARA